MLAAMVQQPARKVANLWARHSRRAPGGNVKPAYWIGIMAVLGGLVAYAIFKDVTVGIVVGILAGVVSYASLKGKRRGSQ
jgi:hypothetical protein